MKKKMFFKRLKFNISREEVIREWYHLPTFHVFYISCFLLRTWWYTNNSWNFIWTKLYIRC